MTVFDDFEPEDAWGPEDPVPEQVRNLRQRLALLVGSEDAWTDLTQELDLIENVLLIVRGRRSSARDALRADDLYTDIRLVRDRLG